MMYKVIMSKRLLDHGEIIIIEPSKHILILNPVSGITINMENGVRERVTDDFHHRFVPPGSEFKLDSAESLCDRSANFAEKIFDGVHNSKISPNWYALAATP